MPFLYILSRAIVSFSTFWFARFYTSVDRHKGAFHFLHLELFFVEIFAYLVASSLFRENIWKSEFNQVQKEWLFCFGKCSEFFVNFFFLLLGYFYRIIIIF